MLDKNDSSKFKMQILNDEFIYQGKKPKPTWTLCVTLGRKSCKEEF